MPTMHATAKPAAIATRSGAIDALRVIAVAGIVTGHVWAGPLVDAGLYTWHVPVFFLLSGYLWTTRAPDGGRAVVSEAAKRFRTIMVPYFAWLVVTFAVHAVILDQRGLLTSRDVILPILGGPANAGPFGAYWFMPALFLSAIVFRALDLVPPIVKVGFVVAVTAAISLYGADIATLPMSLGVAGGALVFMVAGQALQRIRPRITAPVRTGAVCLVVGFVPVLAGVSDRVDLKFNELGTPVLSVAVAILIGAGLLLILEGVFTRLPRWVHAGATRLAAGCLMVVLTHTYVLWLFGIPVAERPFWLLIVALAVPWVAALVINRTRLSRLLLGAERAR